MPATDPEKQPTRQRFLQLARMCYGIDAAQQLAIPYHDGSLSGLALRVIVDWLNLILTRELH